MQTACCRGRAVRCMVSKLTCCKGIRTQAQVVQMLTVHAEAATNMEHDHERYEQCQRIGCQAIQCRVPAQRRRGDTRGRRSQLRHGTDSIGARRATSRWPEGQRRLLGHDGRRPEGSFEVEDVVISQERATIRWRYRFGAVGDPRRTASPHRDTRPV